MTHCLLLAEDEADIRITVSFIFQMWGYVVRGFPNGSLTLAYLEAVDAGEITSDMLPTLALFDIRMPGLMGDELALRVRQSARLSHIPVLLMTAFNLGEDRQRLIQSGVDAILSKPLPDVDLLRAIVEESIT